MMTFTLVRWLARLTSNCERCSGNTWSKLLIIDQNLITIPQFLAKLAEPRKWTFGCLKLWGNSHRGLNVFSIINPMTSGRRNFLGSLDIENIIILRDYRDCSIENREFIDLIKVWRRKTRKWHGCVLRLNDLNLLIPIILVINKSVGNIWDIGPPVENLNNS